MEAIWRVLLLDTKRSNPNHYICLAIEAALKANPKVEKVYKADLGDAISIAQERHCNLFLAFDGEELHSYVCQRLKNICGTAVLWVTEDPYELPVNVKNSKIFDHIFTNDSASVTAYNGRATHLPFGSSEELHFHPVQDNYKCRYDLFFAGTAWPNRVNLFNKIIGNLHGLRVKLALAHNPHLPKIEIPLPISAYSWRTPNLEFARFANVSRAVLTLHRDYSTNPSAPTSAATPGPRLFEVAMAGGFQLVDASLPEVSNYFVPDKEIALFHSQAECVEKLRYYLEHPNERMAIARAAQLRALSEHTYNHRIETILDRAEKYHQQNNVVNAALASRPRILIVTHNLMGSAPWGGVEVYQSLVLKALKSKFEFWIYSPDSHTAGQTCTLRDENLNAVEQFHFLNTASWTTLSCPEREATFSKILGKYAFGAIHFQHLLNHVPSLPSISRALGVKSILSLHDYYEICHHFNLVGMTGEYCGVETQTESGCNVCLAATLGAAHGSQAVRRAFFEKILSDVDVLHANTEGVASRYQTIYHSLRKHSHVAIMGVPIEDSSTPVVHDRVLRNNRLKVAIIGNFTKIKGGDILLPALEALRNFPIDFVILGRVDSIYEKVLTEANFPNLTVSGPYKQEELSDLLSDCHASLHVSIWPETYCLTLSEAWRAGLLPIVSDIGALGERVIDGENGFKFPKGNAGALIDLLLSLASSWPYTVQLTNKQSKKNYTTLDEHMGWLEGVYTHLVAATGTMPLVENAPEAITLQECGYLLNNPNWMRRLTSAHPTSLPTMPPKRSAASRSLHYFREHGLNATVQRIKAEIKNRVR